MDNKDAHKKIFLEMGLDAQVAENSLKNAKLTQSLLEVIGFTKLSSCEKRVGSLLYKVASALPETILSYRKMLSEYIAQNKIANSTQIDLAINYLKKHSHLEKIDITDFEKCCGVGVVITQEEIEKVVKQLLIENSAELSKLRYTIDMGEYLRKLRERLPFAEGAVLTKAFNSLLEATLGPVTEEDNKMKADAKKKKGAAAATAQAQKEEGKAEEPEEEDEEKPWHKIALLSARDLKSAQNSEKLINEHKQKAGGKIHTRFPPEPNGYLHIGHAKAMRFSFMTASENGGNCYLRFDDTNPEKECQEYIINIEKNVNWLGYKPWKITHASQYFQQLYDFAVHLIKKDKAFVCEQTKAEMNEYRKNGLPSPYRNRPIEESLKMFDGMRRGLYEEGKVSLRLKIDHQHPNATMRDPVAYRIKYTPHPHVGDKWCIYPMYDFTHCINDSLENITHSLCTLEFEIRRDLYYWTLEQLDIYRPFVWEYSRLNISNTVLSKRKLHRLVFEKLVDGWDDPRILTLNGLRRRGYTPEAINEFCDTVSVTRRGNENIINYSLLELCIRRDLDNKAKRTMAVVDPVKLILTNVDDSFCEKITVPDFPRDPTKGNHEITLQKELWVERSDIKLEDVKDFFGIAPGKTVGLKYAHLVKITDIKVNDHKEPFEVRGELIKNGEKAKSYLHWIACKESVDAISRLYDVLFTAHDPNELEDYLTALNPHSLKSHNNSKINRNIIDLKVEDKVQFERLGFFVVDRDSDLNAEHLVFNRTVSLVDKERQKALGDNEEKKGNQKGKTGEAKQAKK